MNSLGLLPLLALIAVFSVLFGRGLLDQSKCTDLESAARAGSISITELAVVGCKEQARDLLIEKVSSMPSQGEQP